VILDVKLNEEQFSDSGCRVFTCVKANGDTDMLKAPKLMDISLLLAAVNMPKNHGAISRSSSSITLLQMARQVTFR
jgi:hypothetical protein